MSDLVAVGTYTRKEGHVNGKAPGILLYKHDENYRNWEPTDTLTDIVNPSYLTFSPDGATLFAVSEIGPDVDTTGFVYSYHQTVTGKFVRVSKQPTIGHAPCHVRTHPSGRWIIVSNYVGGVVAVYPVSADGKISPPSTILTLTGSTQHPRQESSHPHSASFSDNGEEVVICDLGANALWWYDFNLETGSLTPHEPRSIFLQKGAGPRHMQIVPNTGKWFIMNELDNTISYLTPKNNKTEVRATISTLPDSFSGTSYGADIRFHGPSASIYASNRGHNSIAHFQLDKAEELKPIAHYSSGGEFPRHIRISPNQNTLFSANQNSDTILMYDIESNSGKLTQLMSMEVLTPVCIAFSNGKDVFEGK
ncbi:MAG: lactonase family protein [Saprospiraceae bacterium]|nr:lactonase family protein [Saprospiraceae bacterium]